MTCAQRSRSNARSKYPSPELVPGCASPPRRRFAASDYIAVVSCFRASCGFSGVRLAVVDHRRIERDARAAWALQIAAEQQRARCRPGRCCRLRRRPHERRRFFAARTACALCSRLDGSIGVDIASRGAIGRVAACERHGSRRDTRRARCARAPQWLAALAGLAGLADARARSLRSLRSRARTYARYARCARARG